MPIPPFTSPGRPLATAVPLLASGTAPAVGTSGKVARQDHVHPRNYWEPADHGIIAWTYDPVAASANSVLGTAGTTYVAKCHVYVASSVTNIIVNVGTAGNVLTASQCLAGLYQGGTLIGTTADQSGTWNSTGLKTMALVSGPFNITAGDVYVAFFANGTTLPAFARGQGSAAINVGITATASRFGAADTGRTTTLAGTLGTVSALGISYWAALS